MRLIVLFIFMCLALPVFAGQERIEPFAFALNEGVGLAADNKGGCYVSLRQSGRILHIGADGERRIVARGLQVPTGLHLEADGSLLCATAGDNCIWRIMPGNNAPDQRSRRRLCRRQGAPPVLGGLEDGGLVLVRPGKGQVVRRGPNGTFRVLLAGLENPLAALSLGGGHTVEHTSGLAVLSRQEGSACVDVYSSGPGGTLRHAFRVPVSPGPGIAVFPMSARRRLFVPDYGQGGVLAVNEDGTMVRFALSIAKPVAVAADEAGTVFVLSAESGVLYKVHF